MTNEYQDGDYRFSEIWMLADGFLTEDGWPVNPERVCLLEDGRIALQHEHEWHYCKFRVNDDIPHPVVWYLYWNDEWELDSPIMLDIDFPRHSVAKMLEHLRWLEEQVSAGVESTGWQGQGF